MNALKSMVFMMVISAAGLSASMVDDFEDGDYQNELGFNWSYFISTCDSEVVITNVLIDEMGRWGMMPVAGIGHDEGFAAQLSWKIGARTADCTRRQTASLVTSLCFDSNDGVGWRKATEISFYAKADTALRIHVDFVIAGDDIYGFFYKPVDLTNEWEKYTVQFSDVIRYEDAPQNEFNAKAITKLHFTVLAENEGTPDSGSFYVDDLEVNDTVILDVVNLLRIETMGSGKMTSIDGTVLSDFESSGVSDTVPLEVSKLNTQWYIFDDSEIAGEKNTAYTYGIESDSNNALPKLKVNADGKEGLDSSQGMRIAFTLGKPIRTQDTVYQPFAGVGCMLTNSEGPIAGMNDSMGLYCDYKTISTNDKFRHFSVELHDTDSLPTGVAFSGELPATKGEWKGIIIPFGNLLFSDKANFYSYTAAQRSLDYKNLQKIQFRFQQVKESGFDISFDNVMIVKSVFEPFLGTKHFIASQGRTLPSLQYIKGVGSLEITVNSLPLGVHRGYVEVMGLNGEVIVKERLQASHRHSFRIDTGRLSGGVYLIRVNTRYGNNKTFDLTDRFIIVN